MGIISNAVALVEQHDFDHDIAYLSAWYGSGKTEPPTASQHQVFAWMAQVKHVPRISESQAGIWLAAYARRKYGAA